MILDTSRSHEVLNKSDLDYSIDIIHFNETQTEELLDYLNANPTKECLIRVNLNYNKG